VSDETKRPRRTAAKPEQEARGSDEAQPAAPAKPSSRTAAGGAASRGTAAGSARGRTRPAAEPTTAAAAGSEEAAAPAKDARSAARRGYQRPTYVGLRRRYHEDVAPALQREFGYANPMQIPRVDKVVVNIGLGEAILNAKAIDAATGDLATITGQKPIVTRAKRSIAQFRLRAGMPIGAKVTLRGQRMYDFLERTLNLALPRIRDFRGIPTRSFDGRGNFSLGLHEQLVFPEIDYDSIDRLRGLEVSIITTASTDEEGRKLLQLMGMPFQST
jgi:large subunit ribosomal protein L5